MKLLRFGSKLRDRRKFTAASPASDEEVSRTGSLTGRFRYSRGGTGRAGRRTAGWQIATAYRRFDTFLSGAIKWRRFCRLSKLVTRSTRLDGYAARIDASSRGPGTEEISGGAGEGRCNFFSRPVPFFRGSFVSVRQGPWSEGPRRRRPAGRSRSRAERPSIGQRRGTFLLVVHEPGSQFYSRGATTLGGLGIPARDAGAVCLRKKILAKVAARKGFATVPLSLVGWLILEK